METKVCRYCSASFPITDTDMEFYEKVSPVFSGQKYFIPPPTLCPDCRQQRRQSFKNIYHLYKNEKKNFISAISPDKDYNVIQQKTWWNDTDIGLDFGMEFNFSRSFLEQFNEIQKNAPRWNLIQVGCENCEWSINISNSKNCYCIKSGGNSENCYYGERVFDSKNVIDGYRIKSCENCYDIYYGDNCYKVFFSKDVKNSNNSMYLFDCENVSNCIGCVGLRNKEYYILNKKTSEFEYKKFEQELIDSNQARENLLNKFLELKKNTSVKCLRIDESENCIGNEIFNSKNVFNGYSVRGGENLRNVFDSANSEYNYDSNGDDNGKYTYECSSNFEAYHSCFCFNNASIKNCYYCETSANLNNCFGCVGLNGKSYCILNRQYTKGEYEKIVPKIIENMNNYGIWGEFFPSSISPYGYNESEAQEYYPLTRDEVIVREEKQSSETFLHGAIFNWSDYAAPFSKVEKVIDVEGMKKLPENIADIPDDVLNWALTCEVSGKPYRIIKQELEFYRKHALPIPRRHPDQRHLDRMALRNPRRLYERVCDSNTCEENYKKKGIYKEEEFGSNMRSGREGKRMITTYAPEREEIVYCEVCYEREVG